jgi:PAS domain S-box-containing protein
MENNHHKDQLTLIYQAVECTSDAIGISTTDGKHIYHNRAFQKLFEFSIEEITEKGGPAKCCFVDFEVGRKMFAHIKNGKSWHGEVEMLSKSRKLHIDLYADAIKDKNGKIIGLMGIHNDITLQKEKEKKLLQYSNELEKLASERKEELAELNEQLLKEKKLFEKCINLASVMLVGLDLTGKVVLVNQKTCEITGYSKNELLGRNWLDTIMPEREREEIRKEYYRDLQKGVLTRTSKDTNIITKNGNCKLIAWNVSLIKEENGTINGTICSGEDITYEKELEQQLRRSHKMEAIGTLAGGIAHDFNNILSAIIGYTDMALAEIPESMRSFKYLTKMRNAEIRAQKLIRQILTFSRKDDSSRETLMLEPIIKETLKLIRATIPASIEIRQNFKKNSGPVYAGPTQIHQIVMNLCANSAYAMGDHPGVLEISIRNVYFNAEKAAAFDNLQPGPYLQMTVSDTGCGMNSETLERIFDPFFTTKNESDGTGLRLAVTLGIVKSLNGAISVESEPGLGSTFHIYIPRQESIPQIDESENAEALKGRGRILFVDDEEILTEMFEEMLDMLGYRVTATTKSVEALKIFQNAPDDFDIVITDQTMPSLSGTDLAKEILKITPDMPIILCTGYSDKVDEIIAKKVGIKEFLMKPVTEIKISEVLNRLLSENKPA